MPMKYNGKEFVQAKNKKAVMISIGLNDHALIIGQDNKIYRWVRDENEWESWAQDSNWDVTSSLKGRMYKIDYETRKVFQQETEQCQKKTETNEELLI